MIIDIHGHLGTIVQYPMYTADGPTLDRWAVEAGVDLFCVSHSKSIFYDAHEGNLDLDRDIKKTEKLLGYVVVNPMFPDTIKDLSLLDSNRKFRGAKIHPDCHGYNLKLDAIQDFLGEVAERVPLMLFHTSPPSGLSTAPEILRFAKKHPKTNIVMAHMAGINSYPNYPNFPNFEALEAVKAAACENVYVDTACGMIYVPGVIERMVDLIGPDHSVYGTDVPMIRPRQMRFEIETIVSLGLPQESQDKILFGNSKRLLGL